MPSSQIVLIGIPAGPVLSPSSPSDSGVSSASGPADAAGNTGTADLISFDDFDLECLQKDETLTSDSNLSAVYGDSGCVLAVRDSAHIPETGGTILISGENLTIAGLLKYDPFHDDGLTHGKVTLITSDETFIRLTGTEDYALLNIQLTDDAGEEDIKAIRRTAGEEYEFYDRRGQNTAGTYAAFVFCVYAFLIIITLVAVLNIINSISMSTASRARQYGMMRAVGMEGRQITKMIAAEAFTYAFCGCAAGCAAGLPVSRFLYGILITDHFPYAVWHLPLRSLSVIILTVSLAAAAAALLPASGIRKTSVTRTISEL